MTDNDLTEGTKQQDLVQEQQVLFDELDKEQDEAEKELDKKDASTQAESED